MAFLIRGEALGPVALMTFCVKFGSNLWGRFLASLSIVPFEAISITLKGSSVVVQRQRL